MCSSGTRGPCEISGGSEHVAILVLAMPCDVARVTGIHIISTRGYYYFTLILIFEHLLVLPS